MSQLFFRQFLWCGYPRNCSKFLILVCYQYLDQPECSCRLEHTIRWNHNDICHFCCFININYTCFFIIPAFFFRKKGYINFVSKSVRRPSVCPCIRPFVTFLVNVSPPKPLEVATLNFVVESGTWCRGYWATFRVTLTPRSRSKVKCCIFL